MLDTKALELGEGGIGDPGLAAGLDGDDARIGMRAAPSADRLGEEDRLLLERALFDADDEGQAPLAESEVHLGGQRAADALDRLALCGL